MKMEHASLTQNTQRNILGGQETRGEKELAASGEASGDSLLVQRCKFTYFAGNIVLVGGVYALLEARRRCLRPFWRLRLQPKQSPLLCLP